MRTNEEPRNMPNLNRIIIEVTNHCNLDCSICLRQSWNGKLGAMPEEIFSKLLTDLDAIHPPPDVFFGGYGEPLSHPEILGMITKVAEKGCRTALITNGTLLTLNLARSLIASGLGKLWISADSFHQQSIGAHSYPPAHSSIQSLIADIQNSGNGILDELDPGLSMVLSKNNQTEILAAIDQALMQGIKSFFITNLEAYSPADGEEINYTLSQFRSPGAWQAANVDLIETINRYSAIHPEVSIDGITASDQDKCPFAEGGSLAIRWDGEISPCLPLLYNRTIFIGPWEHSQHAFSLGNLLNRSLADIWSDQAYKRLRDRLLNNEFSPCLGCRDCWLSEDNLQDCMGHEHPACGGCLWASGLISCP